MCICFEVEPGCDVSFENMSEMIGRIDCKHGFQRPISRTMQDLNDLRFFAAVVEHGGFAPAGRALRMQKSRLSRRVLALEERLGVRLLNRSSRRFSVTEIGREFHERCPAMLVEAEGAEQIVAEAYAAPRGVVRMSCPTALQSAGSRPV